MKKFIFGIAFCIAIGLIGYFVLTFSSSYESISYDLASVTIKNESGQIVKNIILTHGDGTMSATQLKNNSEIRFIFTNGASENSYKLSVTLANDSVLNSQEIYFEYGYRGIETITKAGINNKSN